MKRKKSRSRTKLYLRYEIIFSILYTGATLTKYIVTSNTDLLASVYSITTDTMIGMFIHILIRELRKSFKDNKRDLALSYHTES